MEFRRCEDQALVMKDGDSVGKWWWKHGWKGILGVSWMYTPPTTGDVSGKCLGIHPIKVW